MYDRTKRFQKRITALLLSFCLAFSLVACGSKTPAVFTGKVAVDLMAGVVAKNHETKAVNATEAGKAANFAVKLLKECYDGGNTLVSPLSLTAALGMTMEGAKGETLAEMEKTLGMGAEELAGYIGAMMESLKNDNTLALANSIWFTDSPAFNVNGDFLQKNADYYGADIYKAPLSDTAAVDDINNWVNTKTSGMIPKLMEYSDIHPLDVIHLINALAFAGEWENKYSKENVSDGTFTASDGTKINAVFMTSKENSYLSNDMMTGFIKPYKGGKYAFAALLPNGEVTMEEFLKTLDGAKLTQILSGKKSIEVNVSLPKFETEDDLHLIEVLKSLGIRQAFDPSGADLTGIGTHSAGDIYIAEVHQKTFISVDEKGTKAAAATRVTGRTKSMPMTLELDRPFVYMIIDTATNVPVFMGVLENPGK
jgi:serpin B